MEVTRLSSLPSFLSLHRNIQRRHPREGEDEPDFLIKAPSMKPRAGLPKRVCCLYSQGTHTHTLPLRPRNAFAFNQGAQTCHLSFWHFKSSVCFTCIWKRAASFPPCGAAYIQPQCQRAGRALMHCLLVLIKSPIA